MPTVLSAVREFREIISCQTQFSQTRFYYGCLLGSVGLTYDTKGETS